MNKVLQTAAVFSTIILISNCVGAEANDATESTQNTSSGTVVKAKNAVKRGAKATGRGIKHVAKVVAGGVKRGANATGKAVGRVAKKIGASPAPSPQADK